MKYQKPELSQAVSAAADIRGGKGDSSQLDNPVERTYTIPAYEADE
ncbi:MAG TPA: hypothetical protein VNE63_24305 [Candidatus Acidoferrales bacterium]|nr:hypothetical protein [Candidatus Acidoferrales bacterium]